MKKTICFIVVAAALFTFGCAPNKQKKYSETYFNYFDSFATLTVYTEEASDFQKYDELFKAELERYHQLLDIYNEYEGLINLCTVNESACIAPLSVCPELFDFIEYAIKINDLTNGYTSIAIGSVSAVWKSAISNERLPDDDELMDAAAHIDITKIALNENESSVYISDPLLKLDAGAIAKGYVAEKISKKLSEYGAESFLINLGGTLVAQGEKNDGTPWKGGVEYPDGVPSKKISVNLSKRALSTSGSYHRDFELDGMTYHHIIDPFTCTPQQYYISVSVICPSAADADSLSTALFSMTLENGRKLIEGLADTDAVWILSDGTTVATHGVNILD